MIRAAFSALRRSLDAKRESRVRAAFEAYAQQPTGLLGEAIAARRAAADRAGLAFVHRHAVPVQDAAGQAEAPAPVSREGWSR